MSFVLRPFWFRPAFAIHRAVVIGVLAGFSQTVWAEDEQLKEPAAADEKDVAHLNDRQLLELARAVKDLGSDDFEVREAATKTLLQMPRCAVDPLKKYLTEAGETEVKSRLSQIVNELQESKDDNITDTDRTLAAPRIASYGSNLFLKHRLRVGEDISGPIGIRNNGEKKIKRMEVTVYVTVKGQAKPEMHRMLLVEKEGSVAPPASGGAGKPAVLRVNLPVPAAGVDGVPEVKITYLKFEE